MKLIRFVFLLAATGFAFAGAHLFADPPAPSVEQKDPPETVSPAVADTPETAKTPPVEASPAPAPFASKSTGELRDLTAPGPEADSNKPAVEAEPKIEKPRPSHRNRPSGRGSREIVGFGNAYLSAGETARVLVAVFGNAQANGPVDEAVVAVFGNSAATDTVGQAVVAVLGNASAEKSVGESVVAVLGNVHANGHVHGQIVSVLGTISLGPTAEIDGDVVSVGGEVIRDPSAIVHGHISEVPFARNIPMLGSVGRWFQETVLKGRLLSLHQHLVWPWALAFSFLGFYLLLALAFGPTLTRCAETLEQRPLKTLFAALLALIVAPALMIVLLITVIGAAAVFFAALTALIVGKAAFLAWIGRRLAKPLGISHTAVAVLLGGVLVVVLYTLPVIGLLVWMMGSTLGLGMAVYTAMLTMRRDRTVRSTSTDPQIRPSSAVPTAAAFGAAAGSATPFPMSSESASIPPLPRSPAGDATAAVPPLPRMPLSTVGLPRAGFWIRVGASVLDTILVGIAAGLLHLDDLFLLLLTTYSIVMWAKRGTTVGGIICGLKVVRMDDRPLDWTVAVVRALGAFLSFFVAGLGFIWVAFDDEKQSWHDKIAGTTVVRVPKGVSLV